MSYVVEFTTNTGGTEDMEFTFVFSSVYSVPLWFNPGIGGKIKKSRSNLPVNRVETVFCQVLIGLRKMPASKKSRAGRKRGRMHRSQHEVF